MKTVLLKTGSTFLGVKTLLLSGVLMLNFSCSNDGSEIVESEAGNQLGSTSIKELVSPSSKTTPEEGSTYYIKGVQSEKYLEVENYSHSNGANIQQWTYHGGDSQQWEIISTGNDVVRFKSVESGKSFDVEDYSTSNGGNIQQWSYGGGDNQQFEIINEGNTQYSIRGLQSGKYLDVSAYNTSDGGNIQQWRYTGADNQLFEFELVGSVTIDTGGETNELHAAFAAFNAEAVTAILSDDGTEVLIESTGYPDHRSIYWETDHELYEDEPLVSKTNEDTFIGGGGGEASSFTVDSTPDLTGATVATDLNTIGISVSGAAIFNDQEGAGDLDDAAGSLDWAGAHKGPGVYHYHLEPTPVTSDDDVLVGILLDGVFIYGRKCNSTGTYPTDLDASGGHTSTTQYTDGEAEYHYHIINEEYPADTYAYEPAYVLFAGPFQGY